MLSIAYSDLDRLAKLPDVSIDILTQTDWQTWATAQAEEIEASKPNWRAWLADTLSTPTTAFAD
jgi:hypothetical protein